MSAIPVSGAKIDSGLPAWVPGFAEMLLNRVPFHRWAGLELLSLKAGEAELAMVALEPLLLPGGYLHGGILNALLEPPALFAMLGHMQEGETAMTVDIHVQHLHSIAGGERIILAGRMLRRGRNIAFCESQALVGGKACTIARVTKSIQAKSNEAKG